MLSVTFHGVRGSTPCPHERNTRYGANTSCVSVEVPGADPIVFDIGTGLRFFGLTQPAGEPIRASLLATHLHWDHVQGLPFFAGALVPGGHLDIYGPRQPEGTLEEAFDGFMRPPYFPVGLRDLPAEFVFHELDRDDFGVGPAKVRSRSIPHIGRTLGFRVEHEGLSVAYLPDHQMPADGSDRIDPEALELCDGADLVIHDAQFTPEEFAVKSHWGHCTIDYAVHVAAEAGARRVALFHHDPGHHDAELDLLGCRAAEAGARRGLEAVITAAEGLTVRLGPAA